LLLLNDYLRKIYGCKVYKLALSADVTCPNRDGTCGTRGCIFCSQGGSGEFASDKTLTIAEQIVQAKERVSGKIKDGKYIAYFQSYTNTYAPVSYLRKIFYEAVSNDDIVILSVATRPDCLGDDVMELLEGLGRIKPVWVELGLQTIHAGTAEYIRRGYDLAVYDEAVRKLKAAGIKVIVHVIIGLPGETLQDMRETVKYVVDSGADGIKLQLLHILKGTDLADEYYAGRVRVLSMDEYISAIRDLVKLIPDNVVIHRLTGDGDKKLLIAPMWSADKKKVINAMRRGLGPE
jgi:radical SAM protein (TIGR01212 family)